MDLSGAWTCELTCTNRVVWFQSQCLTGLGATFGVADEAAPHGIAGQETTSGAYWSQTILDGAGGLVFGRIYPADYLGILGYVKPRGGLQNFGIKYKQVLAIPDPRFGVGVGAYIVDQVYALGVVSDANGSLTDIEWFPVGSELFKYFEMGWTPTKDQRYLTNVHLG